MNLVELYKMQYELDERILKEKGLQQTQQITDMKIIAFKVELAELLNEIKAFKYWSNKPPSEKSVILEELVDGIHFLLGIAIDRKYIFIENITASNLTQWSINELSFDLFNNSLDCSSRYSRAFACYLAIAEHMGFSEDDVKAAYMRKNQINHARQTEGY